MSKESLPVANEDQEVNRCTQIFKQLHTNYLTSQPNATQLGLSMYVLIAPDSIHYHKCDKVMPQVATQLAKEGSKVISAPTSWYQNNLQVRWPSQNMS